VGNKTMAPKLI